MSKERELALQAFHILNGLLGDLIAAAQVRRCYARASEEGKIRHETFLCVSRMCLSTLILVLCKWLEFYDHFHSVIPDDCHTAANQLGREIRRRSVRPFRNKVVGHIWDKNADRPLTNEEIERSINAIVRDDPEAFVSWCASPAANFPDSVASIVEHTRSRIEAEFEISDAELFPG